MVSFDVGPHPANRVAFDPTGAVVAIASNDATVKMYEVSNGRVRTIFRFSNALLMINIISDMEMHYISIYFLFDSYYCMKCINEALQNEIQITSSIIFILYML